MRISIRNSTTLVEHIRSMQDAMIADLQRRGHDSAAAMHQVRNVLSSLENVILAKESLIKDLRDQLANTRGTAGTSHDVWNTCLSSLPMVHLSEEQVESVRNGTGYLDYMFSVTGEIDSRSFQTVVDGMKVIVIDELMVHQHHTHKDLLVGYDNRLAKGGDVQWANYVLEQMRSYC